VVSLREVPSGFFVFGLLFGKETGQGDDVGFDLLGGGRGVSGAMCAVRRHV
jgi:hypothetical protein